MRYNKAIIKKDKNNVRYYKPTIVPNIPIKDGDKFIKPTVGDRLDILAQRYYGDSNLWWVIAKANEISEGQIGLDPEKMIRIPTDIDSIINSI